MTQKRLIDRFGRIATNLRVSVTDVCNLRCLYCMPEEMIFFEKAELMTFDEIVRIVQIAVELGVDKIRLTGGEPLIRRDLPKLIDRLFQIEKLDEISLTTNGIGLTKQAKDLYNAGLRRINVSLDTLNSAKFLQITRRNALEKVLDGLREAKRVGFDPIKINAVTMRNFTENEVIDLVKFARENDFEMRFIEFMPLDADDIWGKNMLVSGSDLMKRIDAIYPLDRISENGNVSHDTAKNYQFRDRKGKIGFISSVTDPFCGGCNRVRLTADGKFRNCLFAIDETDLLTPLRSGADDDQIAQLMIDSVAEKEAGHLINSADFVKPKRNMSMIGG